MQRDHSEDGDGRNRQQHPPDPEKGAPDQQRQQHGDGVQPLGRTVQQAREESLVQLLNQHQHRSRLVRDLLDLFGGSPRLLVSNLLEDGTLTLRDLKALQNGLRNAKVGRSRSGNDV